MPGVDFVISPLFEISGVRSDRGCARAITGAIASNAKADNDKLVGRMGPTVMPAAKSQTAEHQFASCGLMLRSLPVVQAVAVLNAAAPLF
jgi:hypothetical protein